LDLSFACLAKFLAGRFESTDCGETPFGSMIYLAKQAGSQE
jgi:hypothetical protein